MAYHLHACILTTYLAASRSLPFSGEEEEEGEGEDAVAAAGPSGASKRKREDKAGMEVDAGAGGRKRGLCAWNQSRKHGVCIGVNGIGLSAALCGFLRARAAFACKGGCRSRMAATEHTGWQLLSSLLRVRPGLLLRLPTFVAHQARQRAAARRTRQRSSSRQRAAAAMPRTTRRQRMRRRMQWNAHRRRWVGLGRGP